MTTTARADHGAAQAPAAASAGLAAEGALPRATGLGGATVGVPPFSVGGVALAARPEPLTLRPEHTALIVVDMQNAYASKAGYLDLAGFDVSGAAPAIAGIQQALTAARAAGVQVVYLQNGWDAGYVEAGGPGSPNWHKSNAFKTMRRRPELAGKLLSKGGWDYELLEQLAPQPGDIVVPKTRYSGFFNSTLDSTLRARGLRNLVFTGIATNVCVESTLRDGYHLEYFGIVLEDATHHAGPAHLQASALDNVAAFFGWVSTVAAFTELCAAFEARAVAASA